MKKIINKLNKKIFNLDTLIMLITRNKIIHNIKSNIFIVTLLFLSSCYQINGMNLKTQISSSDDKKFNMNMKKDELKVESITLYKNIHILKPLVCNNINCGRPYGKCSDESLCTCNPGYVHAPQITNNKVFYCQYKQKSQMISFLLELFFLCGAGHFYSFRIITGFVKLLFSLMAYYTYIYLKKQDNSDSSIKEGCFKYFGYSVLCSFFLLHFYDIILIGKNKYLDGYGIPLNKFNY